MARPKAGTPPKLDLKQPVYVTPGDGTEFFVAHFPDGTPIIDSDGDARVFNRDVSEWDVCPQSRLVNTPPSWECEFSRGGVDYVIRSEGGKLTVNRK